MRILISGASGFIGRNLLTFLQAEGAEVVCVSRETGFDLSKSGWTNLVPQNNYDVVLHLAQSNRYKEFPDGAADMVDINIRSTAELLNWSISAGVKKFIFFSTGNVYRSSNEEYFESSELGPSSFYGATKLAAEELVKQYSSYYQVVILRLFGVYGPGQEKMIIPNIISRIKNNETITLAKGQGIVFSPLYIDDVVRIIAGLVRKENDGYCEIFNVSGEEYISLFEIVNELQELLGKKAIVENTTGEVTFFKGANKKLKNSVSGLSFTSLSEGLRSTVVGSK